MDYGYNSALLTLAPHSTPDPFCVYANGSFYLTYTTNDHSKLQGEGETLFRHSCQHSYSGNLT